jgi:hypothetical protein
MNRRGTFLAGHAAVVACVLAGCRSTPETPPPPAARRPALKTEAELSAERAERIEAGAVVQTATPIVEAERERLERRPPPTPIHPSEGSIQSDILMVNETALPAAEVLYLLRDWIEETRASQTPRGFLEQLKRRVGIHVRQEIGSLLIYEQALSKLNDPQMAALERAADREIEKQIAHEFGDSVARFENHLERYGITKERFREMVKRQIAVSGYTREMLMPQIHIRRDELLAFYRDNLKRYCTDETRELLMIELPFERFLPQGVPWRSAPESVRAQARLQAMRQARAAHDALGTADFREVAREYSRGPHAANGGSWGEIGQPLQPPYDELSRRVFTFEEGQYSEPIETERGWYIIQCGKVNPATKRPFAEVQEEIRAELENRRFNKLAADYILRLAENATMSDFDAFVNCVVRRAATLPAPSKGD